MNTETRKAITSKEGDRKIRVERTFDAPRERIFAIFMDPELVPQWWGRRKDTTIVEVMQPRAGGDWRFRCESDEGTIVFRGTYREVTPPERIVQTFEWDGMPGHVNVEEAVFEDLGDGRTRIVTTSTFFETEERDGMFEAMQGGLDETYDRIEELLTA